MHRASSVLVRAQTGTPRKWQASVCAIGLPCDLALLRVPDAEFWAEHVEDGLDGLLELSPVLPMLDENVRRDGGGAFRRRRRRARRARLPRAPSRGRWAEPFSPSLPLSPPLSASFSLSRARACACR